MSFGRAFHKQFSTGRGTFWILEQSCGFNSEQVGIYFFSFGFHSLLDFSLTKPVYIAVESVDFEKNTHD